MLSIDSFALAGLQAASTRFAARAQNIVNQQSEGYRPVLPIQTTGAMGEPQVTVQTLPPDRAQQRLPGTDFVIPQTDLATEMVDTMQSAIAYKASVKLLKTSDELDKALLDIVG